MSWSWQFDKITLSASNAMKIILAYYIHHIHMASHRLIYSQTLMLKFGSAESRIELEFYHLVKDHKVDMCFIYHYLP